MKIKFDKTLNLKLIFLIMLAISVILSSNLVLAVCCSCSTDGYCFGASQFDWNPATHTLTAKVSCIKDGPLIHPALYWPANCRFIGLQNYNSATACS